MYAVYLSMEIEVYFKELAHRIVGTARLKSVGQVGSPEIHTGFLCYGLGAEFLLLWETSVFALKAFNWLDEAHPHYGGWSALSKRIVMLITSTQYLHSNVYTSVWTNKRAPQPSQVDTLTIMIPYWRKWAFKTFMWFFLFCTNTYWVLQMLWAPHTKSETCWATSESPT